MVTRNNLLYKDKGYKKQNKKGRKKRGGGRRKKSFHDNLAQR